MHDVGDDVRDTAADDFRWLSYGELGQARGISTASAIRLAFRSKWRVQDGNDGAVRVAVPIDEARPQVEAVDHDGNDVGREVGHVVELLETAATMLRERGQAADVMLAALDGNAEAALARANAEAAAEREARGRTEAARAESETRLVRLQSDFERIRSEAESQLLAEQAAREKAEAEAAQLRQEKQARGERGLLARLRAALRGE
jgi:hypothetical protein